MKMNVVLAACYAYISYLTAWLKYYYPEQFMAAVLTMEDKEEKKRNYIDTIRKMGIEVSVPDIRISKKDFTPDAEHHRILYGLGSIKGIGDTSIYDIVSNAPYTSLKDAYERIPQKAFNKRVALGLIKSGAFDWEDENRIKMLNELYSLRKEKARDEKGHVIKGKDGKSQILQLDESKWNEYTCMKYEKDTMGTHITHRTWWETLQDNETATFVGEIKGVKEHRQKNGKMMAFITMEDIRTKEHIDCCIFAKQYLPLNSFFFGKEGHILKINGKKSERGSFVINDARPIITEKEAQEKLA